MMRPNTLDAFLMLISFIVALLIRLPYTADFDGLYGQDSYAYYDFALDLPRAASEGRIASPAYWTLGYPALLTNAFALFGESARVGQAMSVIMGAALSPLVYALARLAQTGQDLSLQSMIGALAASMVMALCGQSIQSSIVLMTDIPALFWATLSAVCLLAYFCRQYPLWLMGMAASLALAILTRPPFALLGLAWGIALLSERAKWCHIFIVGVVGVLILLPQGAYNALSPLPSLNTAPLSGWNPTNAFRSAFVSAEGALSYPQINAVYYAQFLHTPHYFSVIFLPFAAFGLWHLRRNSALIVFIGWLILPYLFLIGLAYQNIRYPLMSVPPLIVLVGVGIERFLNHKGTKRHSTIFSFVTFVFFVIFLSFGLASMFSAGRDLTSTFVTNQRRDIALAEWASAQLPDGATVYAFAITPTLTHRTNLTVYEIYRESPETLSAKWIRGQIDYALLNAVLIESQWAGRSPQIALDWLRDQRGLTPLARYGDMTLYEVGA